MKLILIILLSGLQFAGYSQLITKNKEAKLNELIHKQVNDELAPGLGIGIVHKGKVVYESYAGYADIKNQIRLAKESRFNYASSGKQFTALAILRLVEEGKINLDDDIRKFLPNFYPAIKEDIQVQHLLTHTSGIRDIYDLWKLKGITWWEKTLGNPDAIELLSKQEQLSFKPGDRYLYSNSNYILLTEIIKQITGDTFESFSTAMFNQLGMPNTAFESDHEEIPHRVLPYGFWKKYRKYDWNTDLIGDGALFTTLPDQLAWEVTLQKKKSKSLSSKAIKKSQIPIAASTIDNYGYGLEFEENRAFHHGSTGAYGATFVRYPKENLSIVVMTNYTNISTDYLAIKCYEILTGSASKQTTSRIPQEVGEFVSVDELLGTYATPSGYYYRFVTKSDTLYLERANRGPVALEHEDGNIYHEINDPAFQLEFTIDPDLGRQITAYYPTHNPYTLTRKEVNMDDYDYQKLNGSYYSSELELSIEIQYLENDKYLIKHNQNESRVQIFEPDLLWFNNYKIEFSIEGKKAVKLSINSSRNRNVLFSKKQ